MARKRKITRTFIKCTISASVYNLQTKEVEDYPYVTYFITDKAIEEQAEMSVKSALSADQVLLELTDVQTEEKKLGIPVYDFIRFAKEYEPSEEGVAADDD